ncbi:UNVERIFIED_CONTAM: putative disease resistance protein [Sesamum latifolium]|uniref:Disease resistance protein n=1 Tax=Sesamum latifolium TaxID=2727402 RepID=A0AAW2TDZ6_9LAMI
MKILDPDKSRQLFLKKAFIDNTDQRCPKDLENVGREILEKCNGLPLAITIVAGLLVKRRQSQGEWEKVLKELGRSESGVLSILELSYHDLPPQLKSCFLCLGFFDEDADIRARKLVDLWIAEGLIPQGGVAGEEKETMEEIGTSYLDELINRNMVQAKQISKDNQVKSCHIHDLLHELAIKKAREEISFQILRQGNSQSLDKARHYVVYCNAKRSIQHARNSNLRLHSLFFHGAGKIDGSPSYWKSFELLKVLDFENFELTNLSNGIEALTWLRYLGLRNTKIKKLSNSFGRLKNLHVLDIANNDNEEVPNIIWKMTNLRHLYMSDIKCELPFRIDTLKNLRTLKYIAAGNWSLKNPAQMSSLHKLGIDLDIDSNVRELFTSLAMLENLDSLNLSGLIRQPLDQLISLLRLTHLKIKGPLAKVPNASNFPPSLSYLSLSLTSLKEAPMPILQKLPGLLYLNFSLCSYAGEEMVFSGDGFPG